MPILIIIYCNIYFPLKKAPPHGLCVFGSDGFPNGCPDGIDPVIVVEQMAQKGITLYSVGCEPAILRYKDIFTAFAFKTGGQYVPLRNANHLAKVNKKLFFSMH
jgi:hypothetical protein